MALDSFEQETHRRRHIINLPLRVELIDASVASERSEAAFDDKVWERGSESVGGER